MFLPTPRLVGATVCLTVLALVLTVVQHQGWIDNALPWFWAGTVALLALSLADVLTLPAAQGIRATRSTPEAQALGVQYAVTLRIENRGERPLRGVLHDHAPPTAEVCGLPLAVRVAAGEGALLSYRLAFLGRGRQRFGPLVLRLDGRMGLVARQIPLPLATTVCVYPNFDSVARYALYALDNRLSHLGIRQKRRRGEGLDFHQLRDYREGDAIRQIDWKAAARTQRLISREYQDERDQRVMFLLDTTGRMRSQDEAISHFDQALNAMLLLAHVALRQGDAVGVLAFGRDPRMLPPAKGGSVLGALMNTLFDLQASPGAPDYLAAAEALRAKVRKRSLVVLITNLRDADEAEIQPAVDLLQRHHLVLVASLREAAVGSLLATPIRTAGDAVEVAATRLYLAQRYRAFQRLQQRGVFTLDVTPKDLPIHLVNRYLDVKRSGRL